MSTDFVIQSSDPTLLVKARQLAKDFANQHIQAGASGALFLGAVTRGYFDSFADIDVILYQSAGHVIERPPSYLHVDGFEIHSDVLDEEHEAQSDWNMAKRWAYSQAQIYYDPRGWVARLLEQKIPLRPEERRWLMIEGMSQSNWYGLTLSKMWTVRGNIVSAHHMFDAGLTHFFNVLFGLNNQLVADIKWRYYAVERLPLLPPSFRERVQDVMRCVAFTVEEVERRQQAFNAIFQWALPLVEEQVHMPFEEYSLLV